ncbi:MAG TPA: ATP-binding protein [Anaeromyxobacteraceae bacterium]|nr:ATP-binding protein [Anaeromyxobacteraceae bacterium]
MAAPNQKPRSGIARRLAVAFGALICVYGLASAVGLWGLAEIDDGLRRTREEADGMRLALELASAVRDQYAHQAHTIIIGDQSHLGFYAEAERRVIALAGEIRRHVSRPDEQAWVDDIEKATAELDAIFRQRIVPAVVRGERADVQAEHARAQLVVTRIQERTDRLVERFELAIAGTQARVSAVERRTAWWTLALLLGAPLMAAGVGWHLVRSVARPVARLHAGAEGIARGDLDTRIEVESPDEFGALARQFNAMAAALKEHQQRLIQSEKLAGIGRLAAGVAHEINNPLGVVLGYTRLLRKGARGSLAGDLAVVEEETLRALEIVEGLLDLARPPRLTVQPVDLRELSNEVVGRLGEAHQLQGVAVDVRGRGLASGDAQKLRQVLLNLVRNGAEAAGAGGHLQVAVSESGGRVEVSVEDDGPGIDAAARDQLFEPFFTTKPKGTGLGLAVSRAIARAHGGDLAAVDGVAGARFVLTLPGAAAFRENLPTSGSGERRGEP